MASPLEDITAVIRILKDAPTLGRLDSNNERLLQHVAALMRLREPITAWLEAEAERLALATDHPHLGGEHAVITARALLTPITGRPGPGQPGQIVDNMRAAVDGLIKGLSGQ